MANDVIKKRVFYLEQALRKAWKEFGRLKKSIIPEGEGFNQPFKDLPDEKKD